MALTFGRLHPLFVGEASLSDTVRDQPERPADVEFEPAIPTSIRAARELASAAPARTRRGELETRFANVTRQYAETTAVPRPANWSGFRVRPDRVEFWQERPFRLHDRVLFARDGEAWRKQRLYP